MKILRAVPLFLIFTSTGLAWSFAQKVGIYSLIHRLSEFKTGSVEEHVIYGKIAMFLEDWHTSAKLSHGFETPQFRDALYSLMATINTGRSEAISEPAGLDNLEYLLQRIRKSYSSSLSSFFSHA